MVALTSTPFLDPTVAKAIRDIGTELSLDNVAKTARVLAPMALRLGGNLAVTRDIKYGPDSRHRLDVFEPAGARDARPLVLYVHGGGFVGGDKGDPDAPFYNNVGAWAATQGWVGATMTYRLAPGATWPSGSDDIERALDWIVENASLIGVNPKRILLVGQSAGAAHVAGYTIRAHAKRVLAGAVMLSGIYELHDDDHSPMEVAYYGTEHSRFGEMSSAAKLAERAIPCLYALAELDPPKFQRQATSLVQAHMHNDGFWPHMAYLPDHNHVSPIFLLGSRCDTVGPVLTEFATKVFALRS